MSPTARTLTTLAALALVAGIPGVVLAEAPLGVSPGAVDRVTTIRGECPTFSWEAVPEASFYELVVYVIGDPLDPSTLSDADLTEADEALYTRVPGGATSWTPSLEERLTRGGDYVWFVRGVVADEADMVVSPGEWSSGTLFAIAAMPSTEEVQMALEVLRDHLGSEHVQLAAPDLPEERSRSTESRQAAVTRSAAAKSRSIQTAPAAIRGENPDTVGESYGVVGTSASATGAGVGALNSAGGPDLVLDGSADTATDTQLRESGIYRNSASVEDFTIANSTYGPGGLSLQVDGPAAVQGALTAESASFVNATVANNLSVASDLSVAGGTTVDGSTTLGDAAADTITFNAVAGSNLNMNNNLLQNIGAAGTDFTAGGGLTLAGDLDVTGGITNFNLTDAYAAYRFDTAGTTSTTMVPTSDSFCFLVTVEIEDTDSPNEFASCYIKSSGGDWVLEAYLAMTGDATAGCWARCFQW
jgi:hypothetical protein